MDIPSVTDANFEEEVLKSPLPVLIDFWASWCVPCRMIEPTVEQIAEGHKEKLKVAKMNVDENMITPSKYGIEMTQRLARGLAGAGITLVSGLARGIDTAGHLAALKGNGRTIGVLGCGIDVLYPRENQALMEDMLSSGAVITEFRPGIPPAATNFFRRNRIVSGLCRGVVVVEASQKSGSLITAGHALDQNREVFAVPGNVFNIRSSGPHGLIKQGACLVESAEDILQELFPRVEPKPQPTLFENEDQKPDVSVTGCLVLDHLDPDPVPIDVLCQTLGLEAGKLAGVLLELELKGLVKQHPGKMFSRAPG